MTTADPALEAAATSQAAPDVTPSAAPPVEGGSTSEVASEAAAPADAVPEPAAEPSKLARAQKVAADLAARNKARREREQQSQAAIARANAAEQRAQEADRARQTAEAQARAFEADPLGELRKRGIPAKAVAQAAIDDSTPEAIARRALEEAQAVRRENEELRRAAQERDAKAGVEAQRKAFIDEAAASFDHPFVSSHARTRPNFILAEADAALLEEVRPGVTRHAAFVQNYGRAPTRREVLDFLEYQHAEADKARQNRPAKGSTSTPAAPAGAPTKPATGNGGARTLTSRTAERATLPASFDELDPADQIAVMARQLRETQRAQ
jgi:hypothetical protein